MANTGVALALTGGGALYLAARMLRDCDESKHSAVSEDVQCQTSWQNLQHGDSSNAGRLKNFNETHDDYMTRIGMVENWKDMRRKSTVPSNELPRGYVNSDLHRIEIADRFRPAGRMHIAGVRNKQGFKVGYRALNPFPAERAYSQDYLNLAAVKF